MSARRDRFGLFVAALLLGAVGTLALTVGASAIFGHKVVANDSSSMEPTLSDGDLLIARQTQPPDIEPGDLMTFSEPGADNTITRRVRAIVETGDEVVFETKADALQAVERFSLPVDGQVAVPRRKIPLVGYVAELPLPAALAVVLAAVALMVVTAVVLSRRVRRQPQP